jgi:hypothetical protein
MTQPVVDMARLLKKVGTEQAYLNGTSLSQMGGVSATATVLLLRDPTFGRDHFAQPFDAKEKRPRAEARGLFARRLFGG